MPRTFKVAGISSNKLAYTNCVYVSPKDYDKLMSDAGKMDEENPGVLVQVNDFVFTARPFDDTPKHEMAFNMLQRRCANLAMNNEVEVSVYPQENIRVINNITFEIDLLQKNNTGKPIDVDCDKLTKVMKDLYGRQMFTVDQMMVVQVENLSLRLQVTGMEFIEIEGQKQEPVIGRACGQLVKASTLLFKKKKDAALRIQGGASSGNSRLFERGFNFQAMGIGGLDKEFADIFRRAFASRVFPPEVLRKMGIKHVRGMLLYGPPGCGKTLIARQIGKALNAHEPKIVNGPEILNKYVGESEANIRALFEDAEKEQEEMGDNSDLHIIIFDEIDAICKARGANGDGTGVHDSIVNQLLSKIDGVEALNNVLIIGMTNRKDLIDPALLRPGRLEVHVEIGLPNQEGRVQILKIHTNTMRQNGYLADDVDLVKLADRTKNFTGAELEGLVKSASSFALEREVDINNLSKVDIDPEKMRVTWEDFERALKEVQPAFGLEKDELSMRFRNGIIEYSDEFKKLYSDLMTMVEQVRSSEHTPLISVCLDGVQGCGKTALAAYVAMQSKFPFVKFISADMLLGASDSSKAGTISAIFQDAYKSPLSMIILDDLERLVEYVRLGPRFSNSVLQALLVLIKKNPPTVGRKLMIVATTSQRNAMEELGLMDPFNVIMDIPVPYAPKDVAEVLRKTGGMDEEVIAKVSSEITMGVPVKELLLIQEMARSDSENGVITYEKYMDCFRAVHPDM
ncbi:hypothetical protein WA588_003043 [Blastocystis sp. NMH]